MNADLVRWERVSGPVKRRLVALHAGAALGVYGAGVLVSILIDPSLANRGWPSWVGDVVIVAIVGAGMGLAAIGGKRRERVSAWTLRRALEKENDDAGADPPAGTTATSRPPS